MSEGKDNNNDKKGKGGKKNTKPAEEKINFPPESTPGGIQVTQEAFPEERTPDATPTGHPPAPTAPVDTPPTAPVDNTPDPIDENPLNQGVFGSPIIITETPADPLAPTDPLATSPLVEPVVSETPVVSEAKTEPTEPTEPAIESAEPAVDETESVKPSQEDLEEKVIENWYNSQNKPADVNHFELAYSSGINMDRFSNLEAKVGKFKFKRAYVGDKWQITVEDK